MRIDRWWDAVRRYDAGTLMVTSVVLALALLADYALAVRTASGQRLDVAASGDASLLRDLVGAPAALLRDAAPPLLAVVVAVLGGLAVLRGRWRPALAAALAAAGAAALATVLRDVVLDRPMLGGHGDVQNTLPSGHVAVVTALLAALLLLWPAARAVPPRWAVLAACGCAVVVGVAAVVADAHRPSDVVAGLLVGLLASTLACWLVRPSLAAPRVLTRPFTPGPPARQGRPAAS
ncbi:phosphatase PAP2 family protein [Isoptericola sp. F-RaC21]|uniref:phosphatase PAP2 family protein n=1 Tax=Isoptericola sp. F-RaC21 TaxID=3141452 RepID=UPI00315B836D